MLKAQVKAADEERQQISSELHERISKIDKLRKRYPDWDTQYLQHFTNFDSENNNLSHILDTRY